MCVSRWVNGTPKASALSICALSSILTSAPEAAFASYDVAYLDPPYNQHSYYSNYHIWETLVRSDAPPAYGIARKREDCRTSKSAFNIRKESWEAMREVVLNVKARHVVLSFSNEGFFTHDAIRGLLSERFGEVAMVPVDSPRYVGARIGIHNLRGERVGKVSHVRNTEWVFIAGPDAVSVADRGMMRLAVPTGVPAKLRA